MGTRNLPPKAWMLDSHQDLVLPQQVSKGDGPDLDPLRGAKYCSHQPMTHHGCLPAMFMIGDNCSEGLDKRLREHVDNDVQKSWTKKQLETQDKLGQNLLLATKAD